jgi:Zn finger protein HypA/HybF involved in hydrogenase expression
VHELSLALDVCRIVEERMGTGALGDVVTVAVEVGDDAGVDASSLEFCLEALLRDPPFNRATPVMLHRQGDVLRVAYFEVDDGRPDD